MMTEFTGLEYPEVRMALVEKYEAEAQKELAIARYNHINAESVQLSVDKTRKLRTFSDADDIEHHIFRFSGEIDHDSVTATREYLVRWARLDPGCPIQVMLNSPGGSLFDGMELFDEMLRIREDGHLLTITVRGFAASMASILLQAASPGKREMGKESYLLLHQPSGTAAGTFGEIEDAETMMQLMNKRILGIYAERCATAGPAATRRLTRKQLELGYKRKNWTLGSEEALAAGLIDVIA